MRMVERVAAALERAFEKHARVFDDGQAEDLARAALTAMREPDEGMADAGTDARWRSAVRDANNVREIFRAMVDAALNEGKDG